LLPACYGLCELAMTGGLMSYGPDLPDAYHQVGVFVTRILKERSRLTCRWCRR
jgi:hypothetical protein